MNGRMYDPLLARMLSPDNEVVDPANTQMYNRYSYAFNNPLKFIDPTGNNGAGFITGGNVSLSPGSSDFSAVLGGMKNGGGFHHGKTEFRNPREKREALDEDGQYTRVTTRTKEYAGTSYGKGKEYVMSETSRMEYSFNGESAATYTGTPGENKGAQTQNNWWGSWWNKPIGVKVENFKSKQEYEEWKGGVGPRKVSENLLMAHFIVGFILPGGNAAKAEEITEEIILQGFTKHGIEQAITKGFKPQQILNILNTGTKTIAKGPKGSTQLRVILDGKGIVIDATKGSRNYGKIVTFLLDY